MNFATPVTMRKRLINECTQKARGWENIAFPQPLAFCELLIRLPVYLSIVKVVNHLQKIINV